MNKVFIALVILVICVLFAGCGEPGPFETSGTMELTQENPDPNPKTENGKRILEKNTNYYDVHGTLESTAVVESTVVVDLATGSFTVEGQGTFTGTVKGKSGSFVNNTVGSGQVSPMGESGVCTTEETIISGTGELANLRGSSHTEHQWDKDGISITYSGTCWFEE